MLLPTDGVYGLCCAPLAEPVAELYALKGRGRERPAALIAASLETLLERIPELAGRSELIARALLPGPYTLVLPNPAERYPWLGGTTPGAIGVRVARLPPEAQQVLDAVGAVAASSANLSGGPSPARLAEVPPELRRACAAELDAGDLPGTATTVLDFSGPLPRLIRQGAGDLAAAIARVEQALAAAGQP